MKPKSILLYLICACALLAAGCGLVPTDQTAHLDDPVILHSAPEASPVPDGELGSLIAAYQGSLEDIYAAVSPSVVHVDVVEKVDASGGFQPFQGFPFFNIPQDQAPAQQFRSGLGSGFVWDQEGHIITNNHVVASADEIEVTFSDGQTAVAQLIGSDPDSDLAVLQVDAPGEDLQPVTLADSEAVRVGQLAIAIGNPFGLDGTMTAGIISALGRSLPVNASNGPTYTIPDVIQTDASINPGNSGGVLVDIDGMVIGVTTAIESPSGSNAGIGFVIPSTIIAKVVPALIADGRYEHAWLGISGAGLTPDLAGAMDLDPATRGVLVIDVLPGSPADDAGLHGSEETVQNDRGQMRVGGDVITAIDGQPVNTMGDLIAYLALDTDVGQTVTLDLLRSGESTTVQVTLQARPTAGAAAQPGPVHLGSTAYNGGTDPWISAHLNS